jgi:predicted RNase H-like HicB family nuclease
MKFTVHIFQEGDWYAAVCPEVPEANGQGRTVEEAVASLKAAITLIFEERREQAQQESDQPIRTLELVA